jgi:hypothetical protein
MTPGICPNRCTSKSSAAARCARQTHAPGERPGAAWTLTSEQVWSARRNWARTVSDAPERSSAGGPVARSQAVLLLELLPGDEEVVRVLDVVYLMQASHHYRLERGLAVILAGSC